MLGFTRWNTFDEIFNFQREMDRAFNQIWPDLPVHSAAGMSPSFQVRTDKDDEWRIDVPLPGIDPNHVNLEVTGNTISIRVEQPGEDSGARYNRTEQTLTVPQFLDLEKITASHHHGMLRLTLPLKESVKPRRISIASSDRDQKQLAAAVA